MSGAHTHRPRQTRILLVDDHPMIRERLAEIICREPGLSVCGEAEDHRQALAAAAASQPDLVIVDLMLKHSHGLDLIQDLQSRYPDLAILVVSMHEESLYAERVIRAGARGYISKQEATRKIMQAIRAVLQGNIYLSEKLASRLTANIAGRRRAPAGLAVDALTDRELRVFEMLGRGHSTRGIARQLRLHMRTIETYRARIKRKLHLKDATDLLQHAIRWADSGSLTALVVSNTTRKSGFRCTDTSR